MLEFRRSSRLNLRELQDIARDLPHRLTNGERNGKRPQAKKGRKEAVLAQRFVQLA